MGDVDLDDPILREELIDLAKDYDPETNRDVTLRELHRLLGSWDQATLCLFAWDSVLSEQ